MHFIEYQQRTCGRIWHMRKVKEAKALSYGQHNGKYSFIEVGLTKAWKTKVTPWKNIDYSNLGVAFPFLLKTKAEHVIRMGSFYSDDDAQYYRVLSCVEHKCGIHNRHYCEYQLELITDKQFNMLDYLLENV